MKKLILFLCLISATAYANEELILKSESTFTPSLENRFGLTLGFNPSLSESSNVSNFTFNYAHKMTDFWLDANASFVKGLFNELSANNARATGATDADLEEQKNTLLSLGVGIGRQTYYAQTLLPFDNIYEYMAADLTYNTYKEDFSGQTFSGFGMIAKYSVNKRFTDYFSAGAHFNYNLAVVKRDENADTETSSDRSLSIGFLTVGIDISFYL